MEKAKAQLIKSGAYEAKVKETKVVIPVKPVNDENQSSNIMSTEKPLEDKLAGVKRSSYVETPSAEEVNDPVESVTKSRRTRKAKPLVSTATGENAEGGECAQS